MMNDDVGVVTPHTPFSTNLPFHDFPNYFNVHWTDYVKRVMSTQYESQSPDIQLNLK